MSNKTTSEKLWVLGRQLLSLILVLVMTMGLCVPALAANSADGSGAAAPTTDYSDEFGFLELEVAPNPGKLGNPSTFHTTSFLANVTYNKGENKIIPDQTCYGFSIRATYHATSGQDKTVKISYAIGEDNYKNAPILSSGVGSAKGQVATNPQALAQSGKDVNYYFYATAYNDDGSVYSTMKMSVVLKLLHVKLNTISYTREGMQVQAVDHTSIGPYNYLDNNAVKTPNTTGIIRNGLGTTYVGMDGKSYDNCYCDVVLAADTMAAAGVEPASLENLYRWLSTVYAPNAIEEIGDSVTVYGPAYVVVKNAPGKGDQHFNLAWYDPNDNSTGVNTYAQWGPNTRNKDFPALRYNSLLIPIKAAGTVTVNCYDEDNPNGKPLKTILLKSKTFARANNYDEYMNNLLVPLMMPEAAACYSDSNDAMTSMNLSLDTVGLAPHYDRISESLSTFEVDQDTHTLVRVNQNSKQVVSTIKANYSRSMFTLAQKEDEDVTMYSDFVPTTAPEIPKYEFDFGFGNDALTAYGWGSALFLADAPSADMVVTQEVANSVVNLYYKGIGETTYTVKVRNNGNIDESLTREYPAITGDIIEKEEVDTSVVPDNWTIKDIENVPLEVQKAPEKNVIIIDCESEQAFYTIMYYLDGKFAESEQVPANIGDTISSPPIKGFPGYKLQRIDGTPLTIVDSNSVTRVYYVKADTPPAASVNAKLFKDEYRTTITKSKSGYGVYGLFYVDVSDLVEAREYPAWTVNGGCSPASQNKAEKKYINIDIKAWASYTEGMPMTMQNKNGQKKVNIPLEKDSRSTEKIWVFHFPKNTASAQHLNKFYIPMNWKDHSNWTVTFNATVTYDEYKWKTGSQETRCGGHSHSSSYTDADGKKHTRHWTTYHNYTIHPLQEWYEAGSIKKSGSASIMVNGSMHQDDFTGGRQ